MSEHAHAHHGPEYYVKIWAVLLVLLVISIVGPMFEIKVVTLVTAFGVATIKAYLVAAYFMHLNIEKKFIWFLLITAIAFMVLFYFGVAPDVMNHEGQNWDNEAAKAEMERVNAIFGSGGGEHH